MYINLTVTTDKILLYCTNLISCKAALQQFVSYKKSYTIYIYFAAEILHVLFICIVYNAELSVLSANK